MRFAKPRLSFAQRLGAGPADGAAPAPPRNNAHAPRVQYTDYVIDVDWDKYLSYVAAQQPLKTPPAFDAYGVLRDAATPENRVFGDTAGNPANFTDFCLRKHTRNPEARISRNLDDLFRWIERTASAPSTAP